MITYSKTSLVDNYNNRSDIYLAPIETVVNKMRQKSDFSYYCDLLYIDKCEGDFPDLREFKYARRVFITNCKLKVRPDTQPVPNWIDSLSVEFTEINELPRLPVHLRRLYISRTTLNCLPEVLPTKLMELIVENCPMVEKLPPLPLNLNKFVCIGTSVRELPGLPEDLYMMFCCENQLNRLPKIPTGLRYLRCAGNPFADIPWIVDLYEYGSGSGVTISQIQIDRKKLETIIRFREMYFAVRLREKFKRWLWRPREREAMEEMSPLRLAEFIENVPPEKMDSVLDRFYSLYVSNRNRK